MQIPPELTPDLISKYNRPGPRYTSYPTAPVWADQSSDSMREQLQGTQGKDVSLYFHLPFCPRHCHFCGCNVIITSNREVISDYVSTLLLEMEAAAPLLAGRRVRQIQWGGGSPTHLNADEIRTLSDRMLSLFTIADDCEIGIEINPQYTTAELLDAIKASGFNRISMGIQDFDARVQKIINRIQPFDQVARVMAMVRERFGKSSVNFDLIYGLPFQTRESFATTRSQVLELGPDRMALYSYAHVPWLKPLMKLFPEGSLAGQVEKMAIFTDSVTEFSQSGFTFLGMDHFALETDSLANGFRNRTMHRNFMGYTTQKGLDLFGFGMTSISQIGGSFFQNHKKLTTWRSAVLASETPIAKGHICSQDDLLRQSIIDNIMCQLSVDLLGGWTGFTQEYADLLPLEQDGLLTFSPNGLSVTPLGRFFLRNICLPFDTYFRAQQSQQKPMFSQTV